MRFYEALSKLPSHKSGEANFLQLLRGQFQCKALPETAYQSAFCRGLCRVRQQRIKPATTKAKPLGPPAALALNAYARSAAAWRIGRLCPRLHSTAIH